MMELRAWKEKQQAKRKKLMKKQERLEATDRRAERRGQK